MLWPFLPTFYKSFLWSSGLVENFGAVYIVVCSWEIKLIDAAMKNKGQVANLRIIFGFVELNAFYLWDLHAMLEWDKS